MLIDVIYNVWPIIKMLVSSQDSSRHKSPKFTDCVPLLKKTKKSLGKEGKSDLISTSN